MRKVFSIASVLVLLLPTSICAQKRGVRIATSSSEKRVALVIGNSAYDAAPLKNPVNDARDMAQTLAALGFEVIHRENLNHNDMKRTIREFGARMRSGRAGLFYYAGHGVQVKGENYLVPIGAKVESEEEVEYEGVNAGFVLAEMESARNSINIVILDACRNNPFARSFRSLSRGLAQMDAPSGTIIAYATAPGTVASDGTGRNGLYTQELLKNMRMPGLSIEEVFKQVRVAVRSQTQGRQTPWESSSLTGDFYFIKGEVLLDKSNPASAEIAVWNSIKDNNNAADFRAYLERYPNGIFAEVAKIRAEKLATPSPVVSSPSEAGDELGIAGTWGGQRGTEDSMATLIITGSRGSSFTGIIRQRGYVVTITGQLNLKTLKVTMRETEVLRTGGGDWVLATYTGSISKDKKEMTGTMIEDIHQTKSYAWSFARE